MFSIKGRLLRGDLVKYWKVVRGCSEDSHLAVLLHRAPNVATRGHSYRLQRPMCATDMKSRFFDVRCIRWWNSLPACVVEADSLTTFKRLLADFLGDVLFQYD